ncbi:hypothetical protein [Microbacterium sp. YJN-G]|uniref:hypothetical protein n=1 Tax=Microbacterium sp. YJN-G TaxID=2763257 RepID=UPI0018780195|nr:hypothetical protein [Microbacterium sp. YJN-G]
MSSVTVHRIGGEIELDDRVSWCPPGVRASQPVSCYLIVGETGMLLVDTGIRAHEIEVLAALRELYDDALPLSMLLTRTEMECCLNLPAIEKRFPIEAVYYTGGITVPRSRAEVRRVSVEPGSSQWIEPHPGMRIELISPLMRLLPTLWVHEPETGTLLTSDAFTHGDGPAENGLAKFRWFSRAETGGIAAHVREVVADRRIVAIGPGYGRPFQGEEVAVQAAALADAIERIGLS